MEQLPPNKAKENAMTRELICSEAIAGLLVTGLTLAMAQSLASAGYRVVPSTLPFVH